MYREFTEAENKLHRDYLRSIDFLLDTIKYNDTPNRDKACLTGCKHVREHYDRTRSIKILENDNEEKR